ncbi:MAG: 50S ribosomal protein L30 [archaeon]
MEGIDLLAVIQIRSMLGANPEVRTTLKLLNLGKIHSCTVVPNNEYYLGMLKVVKDYVTWGEINQKIFEELLLKKGKINGKKIEEEDLNLINMDDLEAGKIKLKDLGIVPRFGLNSPKKGFKKSKKFQYPKGELGDRGENINELLGRMLRVENA